MKNKAVILSVFALLGASLVITGCPRHFRPHIPHPHRLPHPLQSMDSMLQLDRLGNAKLVMRVTGESATLL